jgi:hypothetical protein
MMELSEEMEFVSWIVLQILHKYSFILKDLKGSMDDFSWLMIMIVWLITTLERIMLWQIHLVGKSPGIPIVMMDSVWVCRYWNLKRFNTNDCLSEEDTKVFL